MHGRAALEMQIAEPPIQEHAEAAFQIFGDARHDQRLLAEADRDVGVPVRWLCGGNENLGARRFTVSWSA